MQIRFWIPFFIKFWTRALTHLRYKETRQNQATAPIKVKIIDSFWDLRGIAIGENKKNLSIDWEKMYAIHLKLESN